jgi:hypothetical protein
MSAFMVGKTHIDAMVTAAADIVHGHHDSGLRWWKTERYTGEWGEVGYSDRDQQSATGMMLWAENLASIHARYPDTLEGGMYPGPADFTADDVLAYRFTRVSGRIDPVAILKAIACYEYQSCEHEGWLASEARQFCIALQHKMICALPGYVTAPWEIDNPRQATLA